MQEMRGNDKQLSDANDPELYTIDINSPSNRHVLWTSICVLGVTVDGANFSHCLIEHQKRNIRFFQSSKPAGRFPGHRLPLLCTIPAKGDYGVTVLHQPAPNSTITASETAGDEHASVFKAKFE